MTLLHWVALYYVCPLPRLIHLAAPGRLWKAEHDETRTKRMHKGKKTSAELLWSERHLLVGERASTRPPHAIDLSPEQHKAVGHIAACDSGIAMFTKSFRTILLEGVTGSGKTEVYLALTRRCREAGHAVLVLVPEIALTPQMTSRFRAPFGADLAVLHSGLTEAETEREWYRIASGQARVVLGVRRGIFVPLKDIGLIIVDEEHDSSYKSDEYPAVHARDVAIKRAQIEDAVCVLGSASPSLESYANVQRKLYDHVTLTHRAAGSPPQIERIDSKPFFTGLQKSFATKGRGGPWDRSSGIHFVGPVIVPQILAELSQCAARGEQSMVIVNRRGYASFALCLACGESQRCPQCEVTTTLHSQATVEICHHCGYRAPRRATCSSCGSDRLETRGFGTQRVQAELATAIPQVKTERLDRDVMTSPSRLAELLGKFRDGSFDCLIGTQILSKGHDFPRVSLVAVLHLEDALFLPDFRSAERTFQLLLQSAGRAGRASLPGRVLVQTLQPNHPVLESVVSAQSQRYYENELATRRMAGLPPFARQILFGLEHKSEEVLVKESYRLGQILRQSIETLQPQIADTLRIMGPFPAPIERRGGVYRSQIVITVPKNVLPNRLVPAELRTERFGGCRLRLDVDPHNFM
jgi:primosomal protein N' (replication factor Y)